MIEYATLIRKISSIREDMLEIHWTRIPEEEMKMFGAVWKTINELLNKTKIPFNIDDK